jgi:hypothetical protein
VTSAAVAAATTPLPQPLATVAPVTADYANMTLIMKRPENAGGYEKLLWRQAHQALAAAEESGWPSGTRFVWGNAPGAYQFGHATTGENLTLLFGFAVGTPSAKVYAELVSKPGLYAIVTCDKSARVFLGVRFLNRP